MKNIIKLDGIEYIKKSKYDELDKKKTKIKEVTKEVEKVVYKEKDDLTLLKDYAILDQANVCGIFPFIKRNKEDFDELETSIGFFKKVDKLEVTSKYNDKWETDVLTINGSKYSKDFVENMKKMGSVWFSEIPEVYMCYDKEKKKFNKDHPIMFVFGGQMCFILAPRVDND